MRVGAFELVAPLGEGGMGAVWDARHLRTGLPVAVKLIRSEVVRTDKALSAFAREVRTAASLDHPNVVRVLDHGVSDGGDAPAGPWLAMERARQTLLEAGAWSRWQTVRAVALDVLDALAFVHGRGLTHLDVKPANVLDVDGTWKLADFGITRGLSDGGDARAGTPLYMAPEQIRGSRPELGPGTDLYALGATLWHLVTGMPPFFEPDVRELLDAHLRREPRRFTPRIEVPADLESWLRCCLEKDPLDRPRCAAEAADGLLALAGPLTEAHEEGPAPQGYATFCLTAPLPELLTAAGCTVHRARRGPRPLPPSWRRPPRPPVDVALLDAGLALLAVRDPEPSGRGAERDRLWTLAREVRTGPALIAILGPPGSGRSALAAWLCRRVRELSPRPVLRVDGEATVEEVVDAALRLLPDSPGEATAPAEVLAERVRALDRGPALLWIVGEPPDLFALQQGLAAVDALVLVTATEQTLLPPSVEAIPLGPLSDAELAAAVDPLLPLEESALHRLISRARGLPGRLREELAGWVDRELLQPGPDGFELTEDAPTDVVAPDRLPHGLSAVLEGAAVLGRRVPLAAWEAAARQLGRWDEDWRALEDLGAFAVEADGEHGTVPSAARVLWHREQAARSGRLEDWESAWADALVVHADGLRNAGEPMQALSWLRRARALVRERQDGVCGRVAFAVGRHLVSVGRLAEAERELEVALAIRRRVGTDDEVGQCLASLSSVCDRSGRISEAKARLHQALGLDLGPGTRAIALGNLGDLARQSGQLDEADGLLQQALALWEAVEDHRGAGLTLSNLSLVASLRGHRERALELSERAIATYPHHAPQLATIRLRRANMLRELGRSDEAEAAYRELLAWCTANGVMTVAGTAMANLGNHYFDQGRLAEARECYELALAAARDRGAQGEEALARCNLGIVLRQLGDLPAALAMLDASATLSENQGTALVLGVALTEQAQVLLGMGRFAEASERADQAETRLQHIGGTEHLEAVYWVQATASIRAGAPGDAAAILRRAEALVAERGGDFEQDWDSVRRTVGTRDA